LIIENSLKNQARLLMTDEFYKSKHNHGMHQDIALLSYAFLVEKDSNEKKKEFELLLKGTGE
jgi:hypothetical protein